MHPFAPRFYPLISTMLSSQGVLQVKIVPLRVENHLKSVKQHISDYDLELLIDIRKEASMSKVDQQVSFVEL